MLSPEKQQAQGVIVSDIVVLLDLKTQQSRKFILRCFDQIKLFDNKQQDYGPRNIATFGELGVLIRMNDKFERLKTLKGKSKRVNESIMDTYMDIANYAIIAQLLKRGEWSD